MGVSEQHQPQKIAMEIILGYNFSRPIGEKDVNMGVSGKHEPQKISMDNRFLG